MSFAVVVTGIATGAAAEENVPDLRGRWLSAGEAVVIGEDPHVPGQSGVSYTMIKSAESDGGVFIIEEQNGLRFAGRFESPAPSN